MKRLLALFLSLVLMLGAVVPAYATGDGNFDGGGGGMGSGTSTNYWNPGMDGVRISVVNVDSHAVVGNTIDWSNQNPSTNMIHFGKVSKLSYNSGRALSPVVGGYVCVRPAQSLPRIISTGDYPASIAAIRSYFTDEQVIRAIAGYVGIDFETLIAGDYKIVVEPIAYFVYGGAYSPMGHRQGNQADLCPCALQGQRMAPRTESPHGAGIDPRLQGATAGAHRTGGQR